MKTADKPSIPLSGAPLWPLSPAAYHVLGESGILPKNTELLYGFVYRKMSKSPYHSALVRRLLRLLKQAQLKGCFVDSEQPISCEDSEPEPDIAVFRGTEEDFWNVHPHTAELVIEVCISSHDYDRSKLRAYANASVKECWLVLGPEKKIEVYRQPRNGQFSEHTIHGHGGTLTSSALPGVALALDAIFDR